MNLSVTCILDIPHGILNQVLSLQIRNNFWSATKLAAFQNLKMRAPWSNPKQKFDDENDLKVDLVNFFGQQTQDFYECGILFPQECWRQVIDSNGAYIFESWLYFLS